LIVQKHAISEAANFHINMRPPTEVADLKRMMPVSAHLLEQRNRGRVFLQSADPHDQITVDSCLLEDSEDRNAMVEAMQFIHELVHMPVVREFYGPLIQPRADEDWSVFARKTYGSYDHGVGTCKMGPASDHMAVVDQKLRLHGISNLWVGDASIMPVVSRANTNLTSIMIGERLSDFVREVA
jgi:choline dehydrogenase-like flavoprotein